MKTSIIMSGAAGRMGLMILRCAAEDPAFFQIAGGVEHPECPLLGRTIGELLGKPDLMAPVVDSPTKLDAPPPPPPPPAGAIMIEFSSPQATLANLEWAAGAGHPAVIGTTGLNAEQRAQIGATAKSIPIVFAPNMSVGVNTLFKIVADVARILGESYDVEITEMHHRFKKDAPSGTARRLGEIVAEVMGGTYEELVVDGRAGITGERPARQIGMHALRGGDVVGDHTVSFTTLGERIELTHRAHSRDTFARGALRAAAWVAGRAPGLYDMQDVLGLR